LLGKDFKVFYGHSAQAIRQKSLDENLLLHKIYYIIVNMAFFSLFPLFFGALMVTSLDCNGASDASRNSSEFSFGVEKQAVSQDIAQPIKTFLLTLARQSLDACVKGQTIALPATPPEITKKKQGCFVTLTESGRLRGCIGYIEGIKPLYKAVFDNAKNAALSDPRFPPVTPDELTSIRIEISVLTPPEFLEYKDPEDLLNKLESGKDGVILQSGFHQSTFLPQVWEHFSNNKVDFLEELSLKGGMPKDGWKTAIVKRYRAIHFQEN
jgi:AmmeMemoRadiSam system protein A